MGSKFLLMSSILGGVDLVYGEVWTRSDCVYVYFACIEVTSFCKEGMFSSSIHGG